VQLEWTATKSRSGFISIELQVIDFVQEKLTNCEKNDMYNGLQHEHNTNP
jgi:hypothetical protein